MASQTMISRRADPNEPNLGVRVTQSESAGRRDCVLVQYPSFGSDVNRHNFAAIARTQTGLDNPPKNLVPETCGFIRSVG